MRRILISGDRNWHDVNRMLEAFEHFHISKDDVVINGAARGADLISSFIAMDAGIKYEEFPANWDKFGKAAGHIRNLEMLDTNPDLVIVFHDTLFFSKGSKHCAQEALKRNIKTYLVTSTDIQDLIEVINDKDKASSQKTTTCSA